MLLKICLKNYFARCLPASRAPRDLGQQLESTFRRTKIRKTQSCVGPNHPDQRDSVDVMPLGNHLRAHQQIEFAFVERIQSPLKVLTAADGITIQSADARLRKHAVQQFFQFFRTGSQKINVLAATMHACFRHRRNVATIMALHAMRSFVMSERDGAVLALQGFATGTTEHQR